MTLLWNPIGEMEALRREVERAFESFGQERRWTGFIRPFATRSRAYPLINLSEDHDKLYIEVLAPGFNPETFEVSVVRNVLHISGEKLALSGDIKNEDYHRRERESGRFSRAVVLPVEVDGSKVTADYRDGLLWVTAPKAEAAKPKQITVHVG